MSALDARIDDIDRCNRLAEAEKMRMIMDYRLRSQRERHQARATALRAELERQAEGLVAQQKLQEEAMAEAHHEERKELLSRTLRAATGENVASTACACRNPFTCCHNKTASYRLRKPTPRVVKYRSAAQRLRKFQRVAQAADYDARADDIDNAERIAWTKHVENNALRVQLPKLIEAQERASQSLSSKHAAAAAALRERHGDRLLRLEKVLAIELDKLALRLKQRLRDAANGRLASDSLQEEARLLASDSRRASGTTNKTSTRARLKSDLAISKDDATEDLLLSKSSQNDFDDTASDDHAFDNCRRSRQYLPPWDQPPIKGLDNSRPLLLV